MQLYKVSSHLKFCELTKTFIWHKIFYFSVFSFQTLPICILARFIQPNLFPQTSKEVSYSIYIQMQKFKLNQFGRHFLSEILAFPKKLVDNRLRIAFHIISLHFIRLKKESKFFQYTYEILDYFMKRNHS